MIKSNKKQQQKSGCFLALKTGIYCFKFRTRSSSLKKVQGGALKVLSYHGECSIGQNDSSVVRLSAKAPAVTRYIQLYELRKVLFHEVAQSRSQAVVKSCGWQQRRRKTQLQIPSAQAQLASAGDRTLLKPEEQHTFRCRDPSSSPGVPLSTTVSFLYYSTLILTTCLCFTNKTAPLLSPPPKH